MRFGESRAGRRGIVGERRKGDVSKAFRCDKCGTLVEDEVQAPYPNLVAGYVNSYYIRIEVGRTDSKTDTCESCVRKVADQFLKKPQP